MHTAASMTLSHAMFTSAYPSAALSDPELRWQAGAAQMLTISIPAIETPWPPWQETVEEILVLPPPVLQRQYALPPPMMNGVADQQETMASHDGDHHTHRSHHRHHRRHHSRHRSKHATDQAMQAPTPVIIPPLPPGYESYEPQIPILGHHLCRRCLRPRSEMYHQEHPISLTDAPTPPGICGRCRVTKIDDDPKYARIIRKQESERVRLGVECLVPDSAVLTREQAREETRRTRELLAQDQDSETSSHSGSAYSAERTKRRVVFRHVAQEEALSATSRTPGLSMAYLAAQNGTNADSRLSDGQRQSSINGSTSAQSEHAKKGSPSPGVEQHTTANGDDRGTINTDASFLNPSAEIDGTDSETEEYKTRYAELDIRRFARDEVQRYRQAERKLEHHSKPYTHGIMVPVDRRIEAEKDEVKSKPWKASKPPSPPLGPKPIPAERANIVREVYIEYGSDRESDLEPGKNSRLYVGRARYLNGRQSDTEQYTAQSRMTLKDNTMKRRTERAMPLAPESAFTSQQLNSSSTVDVLEERRLDERPTTTVRWKEFGDLGDRRKKSEDGESRDDSVIRIREGDRHWYDDQIEAQNARHDTKAARAAPPTEEQSDDKTIYPPKLKPATETITTRRTESPGKRSPEEDYDWEYRKYTVQPADKITDSRPVDMTKRLGRQRVEIKQYYRHRGPDRTEADGFACREDQSSDASSSQKLHQSAARKTALKQSSKYAKSDQPFEEDLRHGCGREAYTRADNPSLHVRFASKIGFSPTPLASDEYPPSIDRNAENRDAKTAERHADQQEAKRGFVYDDRYELRGRRRDEDHQRDKDRRQADRFDSSTDNDRGRQPISNALSESPSRESLRVEPEPARQRDKHSNGQGRGYPRSSSRSKFSGKQQVDWHGPYREEDRAESMEAHWGSIHDDPAKGSFREV